MILQGAVSHVEPRFGPFGGNVNLGKIGARLAPNVSRPWKSFWAHPMVLLANVGQEEARFHPFGESVNLYAR